MDLFGDIEAIKKAELRHRQLFPPRKSTVESKKRPSLDSAGPDRAKIHKTYNVVQVTPTPVGPPVYNNGQTQWNTGAYAPQVGYQQPQGWQQPPPQQPAPQVQPPQWNQGYGGPQVRARYFKFAVDISEVFLQFDMVRATSSYVGILNML